MELTQQHISLTFVLLLNVVTLIMVASEFRRVNRGFIKMAVCAQLFALIWHLSTLWMVVVGPSVAMMYVSSFCTWSFSVSLLASIWLLLGYSLSRQVLFVFGGTTLTMIGLKEFAGLPLQIMLWVASGAVLISTPALSIRLQNFALRGALIVIQVAIAACFAIGIGLMLTNNPDAGGTLYLVNALLIPTVVQIFLQHSLRLSTDEMRESESRHRELFESLIDAYYWLDEHGSIVTASPSFKQFGYESEQLVGQPLALLFKDELTFNLNIELAGSSGSANFQADVFREDGAESECQISIVKVTTPGKVKFSGTIRDVTERNLLERQFLEAQRRESLGVLASGVAHDFNNILQGIVSHTEFIRYSELDDNERDDSLQAILNGTATASTLCNRLLQYTGKSQLSLQPVRMSAMLIELAGMLKRGPKDNSILLDLQDASVLIEADETLVRQVILNLIQNALDACGQEGQVTLRMKTSEADDRRMDKVHTFGVFEPDQDYLYIDIEDTGSGMSGAIVSKIFDPFFSTKVKGHGLGLSAVLGVVKRHKGVISVKTAPGKGSLFRLALPISVRQEPEQPLPTEVIGAEACGELVLVVDDNSVIRSTTEQTLTERGYNVLLACDGQEALTILEGRTDICLVLSDIDMPHVDGFELLTAARKFSDLPFVLTSGHYDSLENGRDFDPGVSFIPKPYRQEDLLSLIAQALSRPSRRLAS